MLRSNSYNFPNFRDKAELLQHFDSKSFILLFPARKNEGYNGMGQQITKF